MTDAYPVFHPTYVHLLRANKESWSAACCRFAMRRALDYLADGTPEGAKLAAEIIGAVLRGEGRDR